LSVLIGWLCGDPDRFVDALNGPIGESPVLTANHSLDQANLS